MNTGIEEEIEDPRYIDTQELINNAGEGSFLPAIGGKTSTNLINAVLKSVSTTKHHRNSQEMTRTGAVLSRENSHLSNLNSHRKNGISHSSLPPVGLSKE